MQGFIFSVIVDCHPVTLFMYDIRYKVFYNDFDCRYRTSFFAMLHTGIIRFAWRQKNVFFCDFFC